MSCCCGLEDDWVYERRDDHRDRVAGVLARLAAGAEQDGDLRTAIEYTRQQVALDPLVEEPQRDLMRRLAAAGDRPAAIRVYERLSRRLRDELRLAPARETRELAAVLRRGGETASPEVGAAEPAAAVVTLLFTDLVGFDGAAIRARRRRGRAAVARPFRIATRRRDRARRGGSQEPRRRTDGRLPERGERADLRGRNPAGRVPPITHGRVTIGCRFA